MPRTAAEIQAAIDALDRTYAIGTEESRLADGRSDRLRAIPEYERLRANLVGQLNAANAVTTSTRRLMLSTSKGL